MYNSQFVLHFLDDIYYDEYEVMDMNNQKVGVSLTKIIENGEKLAQNIKRGVKIVQERRTVDAFDRVCNKIEDFYNSIKDVKLSGMNRIRVLSILKKLIPSILELITFKNEVLNPKTEVASVNPSPSM